MMKAKLTFLAGLAVGYVLGSKAGRESYDKIKRSLKSLLASEPVHDAAAMVKETLKGQAHEMAAKVGAHPDDGAPDRGTTNSPGGRNKQVNAFDVVPDVSLLVSDEFPDAALQGGEGEHWDTSEEPDNPPAR
jgi:hypothetical protein